MFKAPRSGDFSAAHVFRYRALEPGPTDRVLARFDDGAVAAAEKRVGAGRVIVWTTTLDDSWTDLALKPVFLPLVHQLVRYLAHYEQPPSWSTVGQVLDLAARATRRKADRVVVTPSGERIAQSARERRRAPRAERAGRLRDPVGVERLGGGPTAIAVNLDPAESDLTPLDPSELVAAVTGQRRPQAAAAAEQPAELTREEAERRQSLWWYLLVAGLLLLAAETVVANQLSRRAKVLVEVWWAR